MRRLTLEEAVSLYETQKPKGEFVLVVEGKPKEEEPQLTLEQAVELAKSLMDEGIKATEAAKNAAKGTPFSKAEIYKKLLD